MQFSQQSSDKDDIANILKSDEVSLGFLVEPYLEHIIFIHQVCYSENSNIVIYLEFDPNLSDDNSAAYDLCETFLDRWYTENGSIQSSPYHASILTGAVVILGSG